MPKKFYDALQNAKCPADIYQIWMTHKGITEVGRQLLEFKMGAYESIDGPGPIEGRDF